MCWEVTDARARRCAAGSIGRRDVAVRREARRRALRNGVGVDIVVVIAAKVVVSAGKGLKFEIYDDRSIFLGFIRARIYQSYCNHPP